ncbi:hypothetical protein G6F57_008781 [Rhizopus arrhizus]|nr:hypothetical protein G6F30_000405 [Rhizopus arrhizus]KAG1413527.1 hypothetical protein G6F58_007440 [Rhizopus delemar]KAG0984511.1 hypothetical protein G6F29_004722 [Rhizopus arrhizus]KAG0994798.1 hypothetical protein G6F28_005409 [Rhizopus arrhizus]KAG1009976.1 hypothetical protein G6F27_005093 [Rhizopus arrhizus]
MLPSSSINIFQYLLVQRSAPEYANEHLAGIPDFGSNNRAHANKRNVAVVFHIPKEALKACLLPKKMRPFISKHGKEATKVSVSGGLPSGEASESNEATTKKKGD